MLTNNIDHGKLFNIADKELNGIFPKRHIQRALLVATPDFDESMFNYDTAKRKRYYNHSPYGLGCIATHLRNNGVNVNIINLNYEALKACKLSESESEFNLKECLDSAPYWKSRLDEKELISVKNL